jgi:hypothetical protein
LCKFFVMLDHFPDRGVITMRFSDVHLYDVRCQGSEGCNHRGLYKVRSWGRKRKVLS